MNPTQGINYLDSSSFLFSIYSIFQEPGARSLIPQSMYLLLALMAPVKIGGNLCGELHRLYPRILRLAHIVPQKDKYQLMTGKILCFFVVENNKR